MKGGGRTTYTRYTAPIEGDPHTGGARKKLDDCSSINLNTKLQKIRPEFGKSSKDDVLSISLVGHVVNAYNGDSELCGCIVSVLNDRIIACIQNGHSFQATVLNVADGSVNLTIVS